MCSSTVVFPGKGRELLKAGESSKQMSDGKISVRHLLFLKGRSMILIAFQIKENKRKVRICH